VAGWSLPFAIERNEARWLEIRARRGVENEPLSIQERFYALNVDQPGWLHASADFPRYYSAKPKRIHRPVYPALVGATCHTIQGVQLTARMGPSAFLQPCSLRHAFVAALMVNWLILVVSVFAFYHFLTRLGLSAFAGQLGAAQLALSPLVLWNLAEASPDLALLAIVTGSLWLFLFAAQPSLRSPLIASDDSMGRGFAAGIGLGTAMLVKAHYDVLAAGWFFMLSLRKWRSVLASFAGHLLPLLSWLGFISLVGWRYYNPEIEEYGQGVWIWRDFFHRGPGDQAALLWRHSLEYMQSLFSAFGPVVLAAAAYGLWVGRRRYLNRLPLIAVVAVALNFLFLFAIRRPHPYLVSETFFVVYPLAALAIASRVASRSERKRAIVGAAYLLAAAAVAWVVSMPDGFVVVIG
jgi:hypothetical protein